MKGKGEKERYTHLNAEFQRIARRDKKAFFSDQCKEIEENNRMGPKWKTNKQTMSVALINVCVCARTCVQALVCPTLCDPMDYIACKAPLSMEFSKQEYWSGLACPTPGDLPDPVIQLTSPVSPALQADSLSLSHQGSPPL